MATLVETEEGQLLPAEPFRAWVEGQVRSAMRSGAARFDPHAERVAIQVVCRALGVTSRTLYRWRYEMTEVTERLVDRACSTHGGYHIYDLYPHLAEILEEA